MPLPKEILELARTNVIVASCLRIYDHDDCSYHGMLIEMVKKLAEENQHCKDLIIRHHEICPTPIIITGMSLDKIHQQLEEIKQRRKWFNTPGAIRFISSDSKWWQFWKD